MEYENQTIDPTSLESWVMNKCDQWRDHYEGNYKEKFDEYYRLWRGQWAAEDSMRNSERSRIISPACLLYTSPSPRDRQKSRMPSSA